MRRLLIFVLAALGLVACTQNEVEELTANRADIPETLTVGFEGADDETRVQLQNGKTVWTKGDEVSVFYFSNANQKWQFQGETGERTGKLKRLESAEATAETTYNVVAYPYDSNYFLNPRTCALHATLPATQHYAVDSYGAGGNIMVAQSEFTQFSLKSVCGWLRVELTGEGEVVERITLRGNAGEQVAGLIYVNTAKAEATLASEMGEASDEEEVGGIGGGLEFDDTVFTEVTLDCGSGVTLGAEATEFYIALPPQTFAEGLTVTIYCSDSTMMTKNYDSSIEIKRNHILPTTPFRYEGVKIEKPIVYLAITVKNIYANSADVYWTSSDPNLRFAYSVFSKSDYEALGSTDDERFEILKDKGLWEDVGVSDMNLATLKANTTYVAFAYGLEGRSRCTQIFTKEFTTKSSYAGMSDINITWNEHYDLEDLSNNYEAWESYIGDYGKAVLPTRISGVVDSDTVYIMCTTMPLDYYKHDSEWLREVTKSQYCVNLYESYNLVLEYEREYSIIAVAEDQNGNFGELFKAEVILYLSDAADYRSYVYVEDK